jgi:uncharacterized protein
VVAYNPYIVIPFATWAVAQVIKFAIAAFQGRIDFRYLYASGGMPSVHSAVVCSLAVTALLQAGVESSAFGLAAVFAAIVMYDSFGVRRSSGEQATAINMIISGLDRSKIKLEKPDLHLREILGHQPIEVSVGAVLGVVLGGLFNYEHLGPLMQFVQTQPLIGIELWVYIGIFGFLVVAGWLQQLVLSRRFRKSAAITRARQKILVATQTIGWVGLVACAFQYENASYLAWRLWALLVLVAGVVWAGLLVFGSFRTLPVDLALEADTARKRKWFNFGRRRAKRS